MEDPFVLQRAEKALAYGVVVAVSFATHAGAHSMDLDLALIDTAGILNALVAVMEQPRQRTPMHNRHAKRIEFQLTVGSLAHRPGNNPPRVQIEQDGQIQPPTTGGDKGNLCLLFSSSATYIGSDIGRNYTRNR